MYKRRQSREVSVGNVKIGGNNPISIQSMTNTDTRDAEATIAQIKRLEEENLYLKAEQNTKKIESRC